MAGRDETSSMFSSIKVFAANLVVSNPDFHGKNFVYVMIGYR